MTGREGQFLPVDLMKPLQTYDADYLRDESRVTGYADSLSFPESEADIARILCSCHSDGRRVTVQGARTGLTAGAVPQGGHILNLSRLNRIRGMKQDSKGRFHLIVEPGVVLARLRQQIEDKRFLTADWDETSLQAFARFQKAPPQFFTPDPTETTASIGGMAACNASGARSYRYGAIRAHIQALRLVLISGETLSLTRGQVRASGRSLTLQTEQGRTMHLDLPTYAMPRIKSASGYYVADDMDAIDLLIGSDGTLGVISLIELVLTPLPAVNWGVTCFFTTEEEALAYVKAVRQARDRHLTAIEYFDEQVLRLLAEHKRSHPAYARLMLPPNSFRCAIFCELAGDRETAVQDALFQLGDQMQAVGADPAGSWVARTAFDRDQLVFFRHAAPECVNGVIDQRRQRDPSVTKLGTDMSVPDDCLDQVMAMYHGSLLASGLEYAIWGHIGNNHVHVNILPHDAHEYSAGKALCRSWAGQVAAMGGAVSAEHGVGKLKAEYLAIMYGEKHLAEMARLKSCFDPQGLLGSGNLFGELALESESTAGADTATAGQSGESR